MTGHSNYSENEFIYFCSTGQCLALNFFQKVLCRTHLANNHFYLEMMPIHLKGNINANRTILS